MGIDIHSLRPHDRVRTTHGAVVEVLKESEDGRWILIRYLLEAMAEGTDPASSG